MYDTIIVGAGPAGIATAVQLKRMGWTPLVLEKKEMGGLVRNARWVENYPLFPKAMNGKQVAVLVHRYAKRHRIAVRGEEVVNIKKIKNAFVIKTKKEEEIITRSIVVAAGTQAKKLGIPGEAALREKKVFYEREELPELKDKYRVTIIGSGDIAWDYALHLAQRRISIRILIRNEKPGCIPLLARAVQKKKSIQVHTNARVMAFVPETNGLKVVYLLKNKKQFFWTDYILIAIGREPCLHFLPLSWQEKLQKNPYALERNGLYLAGDANPFNFRHVGIAVGDGLQTAMKLGGFLTCH